MGKLMTRRWATEEQGQALVEFALVVPLLLFLLYGIIQFGLIFYGFITIEETARVGVRLASLGESVAKIQAVMDNQLNNGGGLNASASTTAPYTPPITTASMTSERLVWDAYVTPGNSGSGSAPSTISLGVTYRYPVIIPVIGPAHFQLKETFTMPEEDPATSPLSAARAASPYICYGIGPCPS